VYSPFYRRAFLIATVVILGLALLRILDPFRGALAWAAFLAFLLYPLHLRLTRRFRGRAGASAGLLTALTPFLVIAPLAGLGVVFAQQVGALIGYMRGRSLVAYPTLLAQLEQYPVIGPALRWVRANLTVTGEQIQGWLSDGVQSVLRSAASLSGNVVLGFVGGLVGFFLMLFLLFFLLRDGRAMLRHVERLIPMDEERRTALITYLGDVTKAVVYGSAMTALIQGTLVGIGFAIADLPSPVVFGVLAAVAAFIPAAGTGLVLVPAVIYLAVVGRWGAFAFLALWSLIVGFSDNILRPMLAATRAEVSTLAVFVGVIGGVAVFGFIGLVIGPVLLSLIVALLRFAEESVAKTR
jgi:predicted PurR-regulated permease PerM